MSRPRIAVLMDENTSSGGTHYEAHKGYFHRLIDAGAAPFGVPYEMRLVDEVVDSFDGLLTAGGRFAFPAAWYAMQAPQAPQTARPEVEIALVRGFLKRDKPVLAMCAGMQALACIHGAKLDGNVAGHDAGGPHHVTTLPRTLLSTLAGERLSVNSHHREALAALSDAVIASAVAEDGVIEAIELPAHRFAVGLQWHQELHGSDHPGQAIFGGFVKAATSP
ncbi:gamma-glutamyl-gamma-aminobutyrate hydrolase family protein [Phenylobacterium sp.]|uniref:gamma-glutamyl-gamma-aminobutyrate hydrolase family protein n=1 Tax=Phenylobacterium sp. TaxID=1871053 RepID=UPI0035628DA1